MDEVHGIMDELQEQQEISGEISEAISNPIGFGHDIDEVRPSWRLYFFVFFTLICPLGLQFNVVVYHAAINSI